MIKGATASGQFSIQVLRYAIEQRPVEPALCEAARAEVPPSFSEIYEEFFPFVFRNAKRLGVSDSSRHDVVQEVFVVVHRRRRDYDGRASMKNWIYGILSRVVRDYRRKHRRKDAHLDSSDADPEGADRMASSLPGPAELVERQEAARLLFRLLDTLDHDKREILVLVELEQMSMPQIAEAIGVNVNTLYSRLQAARKALARACEREEARQRRSMGR